MFSSILQGFAIGGGNVLCTICGLTICSEKAVFGQVGPRMGSVDPGYGTAFLARVVGEKTAREIWYLCRRYSGAEAVAMGLANVCVPHDRLDATVQQWGEDICEKSPTALAIAKRQGESVGPGVTGELVMRAPTIGLTRGLWHDPARDLESYWSRLPGLRVHGDFASRDVDGQWYVHGRSDDTLKIAGKRTGPAEIEGLLMATGLLLDAVAVGIPDPVKGTAVVCVCMAKPDIDRASAVKTLSDAVVAGLGGAFRPADVVFVSDLPRARNMKVMRRVVRAALLGEEPGDLGTLSNPEAVEAVRATRHPPGDSGPSQT